MPYRSPLPSQLTMRGTVLALWLGVGLWLGLAAVATLHAADPWHHPAAPFRAIFEIKNQPNHPRAGYYLEVPVCGLGDENGTEVFVYTEAGKRLRVRAMGRSRDNGALVLAGDDDTAPTGRLFAYFGGPAAPQDKGWFVPGLTVDIRTCTPDGDVETWASSKAILGASKRLGIIPVRNIFLGDNPVDTSDAMIMDFQGFLLAPKAETWSFLVASDDAGYLFVNDAMVVERNGRHYANDAIKDQGKPADLKAGPNPFRLLVFDVGGGQTAVLMRWYTERNRPLMKPEEFVQSGQTALQSVESRPGVVCPAWRLRQLSYVGLEDGTQLTVVECRALSGDSLDWALGNGSRGTGATLRRLIVGIAPLKVAAKPDKASKPVAEGSFSFIDVPPQYSFRNGGHYREYLELIRAEDLTKLDATTIAGYFTFLTTRERNPDAVDVGKVLTHAYPTKRLDKDQLTNLLVLARAAATADLETARAAYRAVVDSKLAEKRPDVAMEYVEFEIFRGGDLDSAAKVLRQCTPLMPEKSNYPQLYQALIDILRGDREAADATLSELRTRISRSEQARRYAVQASAALEQFRLATDAGFYARAEGELRSWVVMEPEALFDGQYALVTAAYFRHLGWADSGLRLVDATLAYNELPAFLPELELERAHLLRALKRPDEAKALYAKVATTYPNHPIAALAAKLAEETK